jgi:hypothetical protein
MFAIDRVEQMQAQSFEPITTNTGGDCIFLTLQVGIQETVAEITHCKARRCEVVPEACGTLVAGDGGDQLVCAPPQAAKLFGSGDNIRRFVEPVVLANQKLIRSNHYRLTVVLRYRLCLQLGEAQCGRGGVGACLTRFSFDLPFVDVRWLDRKAEARRDKQRTTRGGATGEDQLRVRSLQRSHGDHARVLRSVIAEHILAIGSESWSLLVAGTCPAMMAGGGNDGGGRQ